MRDVFDHELTIYATFAWPILCIEIILPTEIHMLYWILHQRNGGSLYHRYSVYNMNHRYPMTLITTGPLINIVQYIYIIYVYVYIYIYCTQHGSGESIATSLITRIPGEVGVYFQYSIWRKKTMLYRDLHRIIYRYADRAHISRVIQEPWESYLTWRALGICLIQKLCLR